MVSAGAQPVIGIQDLGIAFDLGAGQGFRLDQSGQRGLLRIGAHHPDRADHRGPVFIGRAVIGAKAGGDLRVARLDMDGTARGRAQRIDHRVHSGMLFELRAMGRHVEAERGDQHLRIGAVEPWPGLEPAADLIGCRRHRPVAGQIIARGRQEQPPAAEDAVLRQRRVLELPLHDETAMLDQAFADLVVMVNQLDAQRLQPLAIPDA